MTCSRNWTSPAGLPAASRIVVRRNTSALRMCNMIALPSDLGIEVEEGVQRLQKLAANLLLSGAFDQVHGHTGRAAVAQLDLGGADRGQLVAGQQPQSVNQCQFRHISASSRR